MSEKKSLKTDRILHILSKTTMFSNQYTDSKRKMNRSEHDVELDKVKEAV